MAQGYDNNNPMGWNVPVTPTYNNNNPMGFSTPQYPAGTQFPGVNPAGPPGTTNSYNPTGSYYSAPPSSGPPAISGGPATRPQTYAGGGNGPGIAQAWAWDSTRYNDQYNKNYLDYNYNIAVENWKQNELANPGKNGPMPAPPAYRNTDYDKELNHVYGTTEGLKHLGSDAGYDYTPYLSAPAGTPLASPTMQGGTPQLAPQQLAPQQVPPPVGGTPQGQGQNPLANQGNMSGLGQFLALMALMNGGGQGRPASPFFNNQRSLFYPTTNRSDAASQLNNSAYPGGSQSQSQTGGNNVMMALLAALLGGG